MSQAGQYRVVGSCLLLLLWAAAPQAAHAAELTWSAPAGCSSEADVRAQVERTIHSALSDAVDIRFEVQLERVSEAQWQLRVHTPHASPGRARTLVLGSCAEAIKAAVVTISMAISAQEPAEPAPAPPSAEEPTSSESAPAPDTDTHAPSTPLKLSAAAAMALDVGVLPGVAPGIDAELSLRWASLRLTVLGTLFPAQSAYLPDGLRGGDFGLGLGALLACAVHNFGALAAVGCGGVELGWLSVRALGVRTRDSSGRLAYGPRLELGLLWQVAEELGVFGRLGLTMPLARDQFVLNHTPAQAVHRSAAASLRATLGVEWTF